MLDQKELQEIKKKAFEKAKISHQNPVWTRAYFELGDAANKLDLMMERNIIKGYN